MGHCNSDCVYRPVWWPIPCNQAPISPSGWSGPSASGGGYVEREDLRGWAVRTVQRKLQIPLYSAVGLVEMLDHLFAEVAIEGDLQSWITEDQLVDELRWNGCPTDLWSAMMAAGLLENR